MTVATAGRAVFFSGLTVLLGLLGLVLFEFMILRSVGIAGAIVVGLAVAAALTLLPALLTVLGPRLDRLAVRRVTRRAPSADGPWARLARSGHAPAGRRPHPDARPSCSCSARRSCTSGSTPRTPASCRPTSRRAPAFDRLRDEFGEGEFAPLTLAVRTDGPATRPGQPRRACTTTRGGSPPTRG